MDQAPAPTKNSRIGRDGRYQPNVNDLDQFDQSRHEHDDRDVWRPRKSQGGYRQETQSLRPAERAGFRDRDAYRGDWQHRPALRGRDFEGQNPDRYGRRPYDSREPGPRFHEGERRAYDPRPARPRSRERSPHRQAHPRQDHSERYQPHATAQPAAPEHRHRPESGRVHQQQRGPGGQSRVEEGRVSHVATPAAHAAINAGSAAQQTDRQPGRNSWGQQANRGRPDPFAGGGKWKHDGFEELQKQPDEGAKETADITLGTAVVT
ncbi:hypothetical protein WJX73_007887 [Symbiochloris irregularis]|uniref:Btz domain-containing protein n=1 Tax=Symbiochloris irregularis TaxID=706552 RepID=A0AAW1PHX1_9CHLO